ncbi:MAG: NAD-dependent epimerase/dehydratase [Pararhodobacter sp.]|nr:NAD-dependent epimerase/dehydratase [Pararhodobacter sp.]
MRVLLVGASGRVGQMVWHHWQRFPDAVEIVPQCRRSGLPGSLIWDPLAGAQPLLDAVRGSGGVRAMVMLAGVTPGTGKPLAMNRMLAEACLSAASEAGIQRVLLASSSSVYGIGDGAPFSEQMPCNPVNDYGAAKLEMEHACLPWRERGIDLCCLRIGNVAGADSLLRNVAQSAPDMAVDIDIFANGRGPVRSYIGPRSMAAVLQSLCLHANALPGVLNLAAPVPVAMEELADAAGHPWTKRHPSEHAHQNITLDCAALSLLHEFGPSDSRPEEMVRQWKDVPRS